MPNRLRTGLVGLVSVLITTAPIVAQDEPPQLPEQPSDQTEITELTRESLSAEELDILEAAEAAGPLEVPELRPCRSGTHGDPLNARLAVEGAGPLDILDPCGLRFTDLSGVWDFFGRQVILTHDQRTGDVEIRLMHVPTPDDWYGVWGYQFGDNLYLGRIGLEAEDIHISIRSRFPLSTRESCPDEWEHDIPAHQIYLNYADDGRPALHFDRVRNRIDGSCNISFIENLTDRFVKVDFEGDR